MVKRGITQGGGSSGGASRAACVATWWPSPRSDEDSVDEECRVVVRRDSPLEQFGIQYSQHPRCDAIVVSCVLPHTPAARADVRPGQVLKAVDGVGIDRIVDILPAVHGKTQIELLLLPPPPRVPQASL